jgi:hypothetical protein
VLAFSALSALRSGTVRHSCEMSALPPLAPVSPALRLRPATPRLAATINLLAPPHAVRQAVPLQSPSSRSRADRWTLSAGWGGSEPRVGADAAPPSQILGDQESGVTLATTPPFTRPQGRPAPPH